jgi:hypothetical protein
MITIASNNSSFSLEFTTFACVVCGVEHISFDREDYGVAYKYPSSIVVCADPKTHWQFHCKDCDCGGYTDYTCFTCSLCGAEHISMDKGKYELFEIPPSITTVRNGKLEWAFVCVGGCNVF